MLTHQPDQEDMLSDIFSALAHPIRLAIIEQIAEDDCSVSELAEPYNISRPAISQHLRVLIDIGLLEQTTQGRVRMCSLNVKPLSFAFSWLVRYRVFWENFLDDLQAKVEDTEDPENPGMNVEQDSEKIGD